MAEAVTADTVGVLVSVSKSSWELSIIDMIEGIEDDAIIVDADDIKEEGEFSDF